MRTLADTNLESETKLPQNRENGEDDSVEVLQREVDHLKSCFEKLIDIVENRTEVGEEVALLNDRMSLLERRMLRVEDSVADLSWVFRRRAEDIP